MSSAGGQAGRQHGVAPGGRRSWQQQPGAQLRALHGARAPQLTARPRDWGVTRLTLIADLGAAGVLTAAAATHVTAAVCSRFSGQLVGIGRQGTAGSANHRVFLTFVDTEAALAQQLAAADAQILTVSQQGEQADLHIPVQLGPGVVLCPDDCMITVRGTPPQYLRRGIGGILLSSAGYSVGDADSTNPGAAVVLGEYLGDLPNELIQAGVTVGSTDASIIYVRPPAGDSTLSRIPRTFLVDDIEVLVTRPHRLQPPPTLSPPSQPSVPAAPRPIRDRQRQARAARRSAVAHVAPHIGDSPQLQCIDMLQQSGRTSHRRGVGSTASAGNCRGASFTPATDTQPAVPMVTEPAQGPEILPAVGTATAMEVDASQPPSQPQRAEPMLVDSDTASIGEDPPMQRPHTRSRARLQPYSAQRIATDRPALPLPLPLPPPPPPPLDEAEPMQTEPATASRIVSADVPGLPSDMLESCCIWLSGHYDTGQFPMSDFIAAIAFAHSADPACMCDSSRPHTDHRTLLIAAMTQLYGSDADIPSLPYASPPFPSHSFPQRSQSPAARVPHRSPGGKQSRASSGAPRVPPGFAATPMGITVSVSAALANGGHVRRNPIRQRQPPVAYYRGVLPTTHPSFQQQRPRGRSASRRTASPQ